MVFMTRLNIRHDQTPAIDDNARLETLTGIVSSDYANVSQRFFSIKCGEYDYYSPGGETLDEINQKYDLNLDYEMCIRDRPYTDWCVDYVIADYIIVDHAACIDYQKSCQVSCKIVKNGFLFHMFSQISG